MALTVQAILQEHFEAFAKTHPLAPYQLDAARQLRDCRTAAMGGHWRSCPEGHVHTPHYNSCHHRSCPEWHEVKDGRSDFPPRRGLSPSSDV
jgi:hypothetical protein